MRTRLPRLGFSLLAAVAAAVSGSPAVSTPAWAPAGEATINPGVQTFVDGAQCTANFVFVDGTDVYLGSAAHCAADGSATDTNGCTTPAKPIGTPVEVDGAQYPATLAYSSWGAMQAAKETVSNACRYNDFALYKLDPRDHGRVNPSVPFWGGPTAEGADTTLGDDVHSYGNSGLRLGIDALSPKTGTSLGEAGGGWTHSVYTATPGIPGDSGSAFLDGTGAAMGVVSTVAIAPFAGSNGVSDLRNALAYARNHGMPGITLVLGTEPFQPAL